MSDHWRISNTRDDFGEDEILDKRRHRRWDAERGRAKSLSPRPSFEIEDDSPSTGLDYDSWRRNKIDDLQSQLRPAITPAAISAIAAFLPVKGVSIIVVGYLNPSEVLRVIPTDYEGFFDDIFLWRQPFADYSFALHHLAYENSVLRFRNENQLPSWPVNHGVGCAELHLPDAGRTVGHWLRTWDCDCIGCYCSECSDGLFELCRCFACKNGECCPRGGGWWHPAIVDMTF